MEIANDLVSNMSQFYEMILESQSQIDSMIISCNDPSVDGGMMIRIIGTYRYVVGDYVFYYTYMAIMMGLGYTVYKIAILIKDNLFNKDLGAFFKKVFMK